MKLQQLLSYTRKAVDEYQMIEDGDHIVEPGEETEDDIDWESICP